MTTWDSPLEPSLVAPELLVPNPLREEEVVVELEWEACVLRVRVLEGGAPARAGLVRWGLGRGICPRAAALRSRLARLRGALSQVVATRGADTRAINDVGAGLASWSREECYAIAAPEDLLVSLDLRGLTVAAILETAEQCGIVITDHDRLRTIVRSGGTDDGWS